MNASDSVPDGVPSATAEAIRSVEKGKVSAEDLKKLQTGKIYDGVVSQKSRKIEQEVVPEKGVVISGKFIPTEVPEGLSVGDSVKVQVLIHQESISIKFLQIPKTEVSEEAAAAFKEVLKALDLDGSKLQHLKLALEQGSTATASGKPVQESAETADLLRPLFSELSSQEKLLGERVLRDPGKLADLLRQYESETVVTKSTVFEAGEATVSEALKESLSADIQRAVKELKAEISKILAKLPQAEPLEEGKVNPEQVPSTAASGSAEGIKLPEPAKTASPQLENAVKAEKPVLKLIETLKSFSSEITERIKLTDTRVIQFVRQQLESLKGESASLEKTVQAASSSSGQELLIETLKNIEAKASSSPREAEQAFLNFARDFRAKLETLPLISEELVQKSASQSPELRAVLQEALRELTRQFAPQGEQGAEEAAHNFSKIFPKDFSSAVKSLEAQIKTLQSLPLQPESSETADLAPQEIKRQVDQLLNVLKQIDLPKMEKVDLEQIKTALKEVMALPEQEILRPVLEIKELALEILKEVEKPLSSDRQRGDRLTRLLKVLEEKSGKAFKVEESSGAEAKDLPQAEFSRSVAKAVSLLRELVERSEVVKQDAAEVTRPENRQPAVKSAANDLDLSPSKPVSRFLEALKSLSSEITEKIKFSENRLIQFVKEQLEGAKISSSSLEKTMTAASTKGGVELLLETLKTVEARFSEQPAAAEKVLLDFVKSFRARLEAAPQAGERPQVEIPAAAEVDFKEILKEGLRELLVLSKGLEKAAGDGSTKEAAWRTTEETPRKLINLIKSVDAQIRTLLNSSGEKEASELSQPAAKDYSGRVDRLLSILNQVETAKVKKLSEELKSVLKEIINFSEKEVLRPVIELKDLSSRILAELGKEVPADPHKTGQLIKMVKQLEDEIQKGQTPRRESGAGNEIRESAQAKDTLSQTKIFQTAEKALKLLKEYILETKISSPGLAAKSPPEQVGPREQSRSERTFLEFAKNFRGKLEALSQPVKEHSPTELPPPSLPEVLKEGLRDLARQFAAAGSEYSEPLEQVPLQIPKSFPEGHARAAKELEREIKTFLRAADNSGLERLMETLKAALARSSSAASESEQAFLEFSKIFQQKLEVVSQPLTEDGQAESSSSSTPAVKEVLKEGLRELTRQFGAQTKASVNSTARDVAIHLPADFSRELASLVKFVEAQVKSLLTLPARQEEVELQQLDQTSIAKNLEAQAKQTVEQVRPGKEGQVNLEELSKIEKPVARLLETLRSLSSELSDKIKISETKIVQFVREQLESLKGATAEIQQTIHTTSTASGTELLLETLKTVESKVSSWPSEPEQRFLEFTKAFQTKLEAAAKPLTTEGAKENPPALKEVLKEGLRELARQFGLQAEKPEAAPAPEEAVLRIPESFPRELAAVAKSIEGQIKTLLSLPTEQEALGQTISLPREYFGQLEKLLEVLNQIDTTRMKTAVGTEKFFLEFTLKLRENLQSDLSSGAAPDELQELLSRAMQDLNKLFTGEQSPVEHFDPQVPEDLPKQLRPAYQKISSLLKELLEKYDAAEKRSAASAEDKLLFDLLALSSAGKEISEPGGVTQADRPVEVMGQALLQRAENVIKMLDRFGSTELFQDGLERQILDYIRSQMTVLKETGEGQSSGQEVFKLFEKVLSELGKVPELDHEFKGNPAEGEKISPVFRKIVELFSKEIQDLFWSRDSQDSEVRRQILEYLSTNIITTPDRQMPAGGNSEMDLMIQKLLNLMGDFKHDFSEAGTAAEARFSEFLHQFSSNLEGQNMSSAAARGEILRKALETLQRRFNPQKSGIKNTSLLKDTLKDLKTLENIVRGHEVLRQLNPILRTIGEPAMLMFPTLVQGFLATLEVTFCPVTPPDDAEEESKGKQGSSGGYQRINFCVNLPGPGKVQVDIAHRREELLVHLVVRDQEVKEFMSEFVSKLEKSLSKLGYDQAEIIIQAGSPVSSRPHWVGEIVRRDAIIA